MTDRVLVALDGSEQATTAREYAIAEYPEATLVLIHVIDPIEAGYSLGAPAGPAHSEEWYEESKAAAESLFATTRDEAEAVDFAGDIETVIEVGRPARMIVEYTEDNEIDHVIMGSHGRSGVTRVLLGSVAETVVRRSPVPVTVVR
ncbi:MAG: universal stress protein [Halobacteriaceae archaeon]